MPNVKKAIFLHLKILAIPALLFFVFLAKPALAVSIVPSVEHVIMDPGEEKVYSVQVTNDSAEAKSFAILVRTFKTTENSGVPIFDDLNSQSQVAKWVTLASSRVVLPGGLTKPIAFSVAVPQTATPGSYFFAVFVEDRGASINSNEVRTSTRVGSLFGLTVKGNGIIKGDVNKFAKTSPDGSLPFKFSTEYQNDGNIVWQPAGSITIADAFGFFSAQAPLNIKGRAVLPKSVIIIDEDWAGDFPYLYRIIPAPLYAYASVGLPDGTSKTLSIKFWFFATSQVGAGLVLIIFIILWVLLRKKSRNKTFVKKALKSFIIFAFLFGTLLAPQNKLLAVTTDETNVTVSGSYTRPGGGVVQPPGGNEPNTTITISPAVLTNQNTAEFQFTSDAAGATFECKIENNNYANCASPKSYINLTEGGHTFTVRATKDGMTDPSPASFAWTIDSTAPVIENINVSTGEHTAVITWSTDAGISTNVVYSKATQNLLADGVVVAGVEGVAGAYSVSLNGLVSNTSYKFIIKVVDAAGNAAQSAETPFTTQPDLTPPANPNNFVAVAGNAKVNLSWENPVVNDFAGVRLIRKIGAFPANQTDGTQVFQGNAVTFEDLGLTNGTTYKYALFAFDSSNNFSSGVLAQGMPVEPVEAPLLPACNDTIDNDADGQVDFPNDPGCSNLGDNSETDAPPVEPPEEGGQPDEGGQPEEGGGAQEEVPEGGDGVVAPAGIGAHAFSFFLQQRTIRAVVANNTIKVLPGVPISALMQFDDINKDIDSITFSLNGDDYIVAKDEQNKKYFVDVSAPTKIGKYTGFFKFNLVGGEQELTVINFEVIDKFIIHDKDKFSLQGVSVTVFAIKDGAEVLWDAQKFFQANPVVTENSGLYGFMVPEGLYKLNFQKDGYDIHKTLSFEADGNILGRNFEMVLLPQKLEEINLQNSAKILKEQSIYLAKIGLERTKEIGSKALQLADNPQVEDAAKNVVAPVSIGVAVVAAIPAIEFAGILPLLRFLFLQPVFFFGKRKRKGWGVVYNSLTKLPVDLAIIRLVDSKTNAVIQTHVTDRNGRYAFLAMPGQYKIEVRHKDFVFPSKLLSGQKEDKDFIDLYHGEDIEVKNENALLTANIPLDPPDVVKPPISFTLRKIARKSQRAVAFVGIVASVVAFAITPSVLIGALIGVHAVLYFVMRRLAYPVSPKSWGIVYDKQEKLPVGRAIARIFDKQFNKLLETQITDSKGRYSFLVGKNKYYVTFEKTGYTPGSVDEIDLTNKEEGEGVIGVNVGLDQLGQQTNNVASNVQPPRS